MAMTMKQVQNLLQYLGYYKDIPDDLYGPKTLEAITKFQTVYEKMGIDGIQSPQLEAALLDAVATGQHFNPEETPEQPQEEPDSEDFWAGIKYFKREEFRCKCGGKYCNGYPVEIDMNMVKIADEIRNRIGKPIQINSGIRCKTHNANVGGVSNSRHLYGNAADLGCPSGCTPEQMASIAEEIMGDTGGIGTYPWGIHIDTRSTKSRWNG